MAENREIFVGREELLARLRQEVFTGENKNYCYSLIGPEETGRTTLIRHLGDELEEKKLPNVYYFKTYIQIDDRPQSDGDRQRAFWRFWGGLLQNFARKIPEEALRQAPKSNAYAVEEVLAAYAFFQRTDVDLKSESYHNAAQKHLDLLFTHYTDLGIRIIITIDEFDRAEAMSGGFFQHLFSLTPKGGADNNLSIVTISRRNVGLIAHDMQDGSDFSAGYPSLPLRGFSNRELEEFFSAYEDRLGMKLPEEARRKILFLCGRSPGLLSHMLHEIELAGNTDIDRIYAEHGSTIERAYQQLCTLMMDMEDKSKGLRYIDVFCQEFIGPIYSEGYDHRRKKMYNSGFITITDAGEDDINVLSGLVDRQEKAQNTPTYEPLSPNFVEYVQTVFLPDDTVSLVGVVDETERTLRRIIMTELKEKLGDKWQEEADSFAKNKDSYLVTLKRLARNNSVGRGEVAVSKLDVMGFKDYYEIIKAHWNELEPYFSYTCKDLEGIMDDLAQARNTKAHLNERILNNESRGRLMEECKNLLAGMRRTKGETAPPAKKTPAPVKEGPLPTEEEQKSLMKLAEVELSDLTVTVRGGLRGRIAGSAYEATLSPKHLKDMGILAGEYAGKTIKVRLSRWDENGCVFNGEIV